MLVQQPHHQLVTNSPPWDELEPGSAEPQLLLSEKRVMLKTGQRRAKVGDRGEVAAQVRFSK
jgi:hypothetical protein